MGDDIEYLRGVNIKLKGEYAKLPRPGDHIVIHWGGEPDIHMEFLHLESEACLPPTEDYHYLHGVVRRHEFQMAGEKEPMRWAVTQTCMARYVEPGVYEMLPAVWQRGG